MKRKDNDLPNSIEEAIRAKTFQGNERAALSSADADQRNSTLSSNGFPEAYRKLLERVIPSVDVRDPSTWAVYGSAEKYYESAFSYISDSYPYDGSALEKINWSLSASAIDLAILQHEYPKTTGYVDIAASGWGTTAATSGRYGLSNNPQYIKFSGGPYIGSVFDSSTQRGSNLKIDASKGNTVEFWMKKDAFVSDANTQTEVVFDSHTIDFAEGNSSYGRFLVELSSSAGSPFYVTCMSGTAGADRQQIGSGVTSAAVADGNFHHYAISTFHTGSNLLLDFYIDGIYNSTTTVSAPSFGAVTGYFNGAIGALRAQKNSTGGLGYGQFSGSVDSFRFWKTKRTAEEIGNYYDFSVNGATDTETIDSVLGVSYKFNEGITGITSQDKVVLDYSGRLNNGEFVGYASSNRNASSAITKASVTTQSEVGDPILNSKSSLVTSKLSELIEIGKAYDKRNNSSIFKTVPQWAYETKEGSSNLDSNFSILLQTIAEKFDSIRMMIDGVPRIGFTQYKDFVYSKGSANHSENFSTLLGCSGDFDLSYGLLQSEENFSVQNLISRNFSVEESPVTNKTDINEFFYNLKFDLVDKNNGLSHHFIHSKAEAVKNRILNAIHINLPKIYKTKGTYESFRNLIRCFGVDEKLVIPNVYAQNIEKEIKDEPIYEAYGAQLLSFTGSNRNVTLHQTASTSEERNYIGGKATPAAFTMECKAFMPALTSDNSTDLTTSIFGMNEVTGNVLEITANNNSGLVVTAVKSKKTNNGAKFNLSSSSGVFTEITTDYFREVFTNKPWFLSIRFSEDTDASFYNVNNKLTSDKKYKVEFVGYQYEQDLKISSFHLSSSISSTNFQNILSGNKSVFLGANRQGVTGSLINSSDCKIISFSYWDDYINDSELQLHAQNAENLGRLNPLENRKSNQGDNIDSSDSLVLHWQFEEVDNLDANTTLVYDHSSGSVRDIVSYGALGYKYPGVTYNLQNQETITQVEFPDSIRHIPIDNLYSRSKVEIKSREIESFELESRPITYLYTFEKSMYQAISREMLNMIAGVSAYNEIIGEPVYKYRQEYKSLEKLRDKFFSKVENDISLERFIEYYKWIDSALGKMLEQLQPATSAMHVGLEDTVESHTFERNKYKHQSPQLEYKDPKISGQILGVNELLYDWEHGHAPLSDSQSDNCLWWKERADREDDHKVSTDLDAKREDLRRISVTDVSGSTYALRRLSRPYRFTGDNIKTIEIGSNRNANKNKELYKLVNTGKSIVINKSDIYEFKVCDDVLSPQAEKVYSAKTNVTETVSYLDADSDMLLPFSMYSSSAPSPNTGLFKDKLKITNNHDDNVPSIQSTFSRIHNGGMPHRRVLINTPDIDRPEAYKITLSTNKMTIEQASGARSLYERGTGINSAYIFQNIKSTTGSLPNALGNYSHDYDIVMTAGRSANNRHLAETSSFSILPVSSNYISGLPDYKTPIRARNEHVIVNTFSSPGGPETQGAYGRDKETGEFSIYNTINYRNLSVRDPLNKLHSEKTEKRGYRSGSATQASVHMTNRNNLYVTGTYSQKTKQDNFFVQHPIPQNDFSYSWITASAMNTKFDFVKKNAGFGHQHNFAISSSIPFGATAATAIITFTDANTAPSNGEKITLTSFDGTEVTYFASTGSITSSTVISAPTSGLSPGATSAQSLADQIDRELGFPSAHFGKIKAEYNAVSATNIQVILTQLTGGTAGNTTITSNLSNVAAPALFAGGKNAGTNHYKSSESIQFLSASVYGSAHTEISSGTVSHKYGRTFGVETPIPADGVVSATTFDDFIPVDFVGLNTNIHEQLDAQSNTLGSALTITFNSISTDNNYINQDFVDGPDLLVVPGDSQTQETWLNQSDTRHGVAATLNSAILNRQGPYGWPSWKQLRTAQHPIARLHRRTNTISRVYLGIPLVGTGSISTTVTTPSMNIGASLIGGLSDAYERARDDRLVLAQTKSRLVKNYKESPVTTNFSPIRMVIHGPGEADQINRAGEWVPGLDFRRPQYFTTSSVEGQLLYQNNRESNWFTTNQYYRDKRIDNSSIFISSETLQNDFVTFSNKELLRDMGHVLDKKHSFFSFADNIFSSLESQNPVSSPEELEGDNLDLGKQVELCYTETIYPREENMFLSQTRKRELFDYHPWDSLRTARDILFSGSVNYSKDYLVTTARLKAFPTSVDYTDSDSSRLAHYGKYDIINIGTVQSGSAAGAFGADNLESYRHITSSTWPLDARTDFSKKPVNIHNSFFNLGANFLSLFSSRTAAFPNAYVAQGSSGEGILQNDFSTFPLGYNNLYGTPPFSTVYNRRIPQFVNEETIFLAGEAKWEAADATLGPFYDSYDQYAEEIRQTSKDHSLVPEFRISEFTEQILSGEREYPAIGADFLIMTGTSNSQSSADVSVGGQFFKSYSNSEFLKYFSTYDEEVAGDPQDPKNNIQHARINFRCKAAMKFLPYEGFYPAERATEITRLFNKLYLSDSVVDSARIGRIPQDLKANQVYRFAKLRANASRYQVTKPLFGPGILFNSIKAGLAVDYPIFFTDYSSVITQFESSASLGVAIQDFKSLNISSTSNFTGSIINDTADGDTGIPRIKSYTTSRVEFEDMLNPVNLYGETVYDNEPHPSASLVYGNDQWHKIIERPTTFGGLNNADMSQRLGLRLNNTREALSRQLLPYTLAMQNFAAESVNFFVEDGHLTTIMSKPVDETFVSGTTYKMKVRVTNVDTTMYDRHSAFGPPVDDSGDGVQVTNYTANTPGTRASVEFAFRDWEADAAQIKSIVAENANNVLPSISWNVNSVSGSSGGDITFYNSATYTPTLASTAKQMYVDLSSFSIDVGKNLATAFSSSIDLSGSVLNATGGTGGVGYLWQITKTDATVKLEMNNIGATGSSFRWSFEPWKQGGVTYQWNGTLISASSPTTPFSNGTEPPASLWTSSVSTSKSEHGFMPYVPPYLDPNADPYVEISFTPSETKKYEAKDIIQDSTFEYYNFHKDPTNKSTNTNYVHAMSLSASLNLGLCVSLRTDNVETIEDSKQRGKAANRFDINQNKKLSRWAIQTKWETPVLDFSFVTASAIDLATGQVTQTSGSPWKEKYWDSYYERGRSNASATIGNFLTCSVGMWHQNGSAINPNSQKGYFLRVEDVTGSAGSPGLASKLGFNAEEEQSTAVLKKAKNYRSRIGSVENKKVVKEAIVAIPYVIREDEDNKVDFVKFNQQFYDQAVNNIQIVKQEMATKPLSDSEEIQSIRDYQRFTKTIDRKTKEPQSDCPVDAIEYQLLMMEEFILPPEFDFVNTSREFQVHHDLEPFMMYFFQFHASFDRQDLANIWQNMYPVSANSTASPRYSQTNKRVPGRLRVHGDVSYVSHYLETIDVSGQNLSPVDSPRDLFSPFGDKNKTRWLVFKVKQRGKTNLEEIRKASIDPRVSNVEKLEYVKNSKESFTDDTLPAGTAGLQQDGTMSVQYNWPYDYFSFVELIKLETKIDSFNFKKQ